MGQSATSGRAIPRDQEHSYISTLFLKPLYAIHRLIYVDNTKQIHLSIRRSVERLSCHMPHGSANCDTQDFICDVTRFGASAGRLLPSSSIFTPIRTSESSSGLAQCTSVWGWIDGDIEDMGMICRSPYTCIWSSRFSGCSFVRWRS